MTSSASLMPMTSESAQFIDGLFNQLKATLQLNEVTGAGGSAEPLHTFYFPRATEADELKIAGHLRILDGGNHPHILKVLQLSLDFGMIGADANALHIITKPHSMVPHCSIEYVHYDPSIDVPRNPAVSAGVAHYGSYINLISRVDQAINQAYLHHIYDPLHDGVMAIKNHATIRNAVLPLWQAACFQPWIITAMSSSAEDYAVLREQGQATINHALSMLANDIPHELISDQERAHTVERDRLNRLLFNSPEVDSVWPRIARLIGDPDALRLREVLSSQVVEAAF
jgi:hypothetical protein